PPGWPGNRLPESAPPRRPPRHAQEPFRQAKARVVNGFECEYLHRALSRHGGNVAQAARASSKHRRAFWALMRKHGIQAAPYRQAAADGLDGGGAARGRRKPLTAAARRAGACVRTRMRRGPRRAARSRGSKITASDHRGQPCLLPP
ncbi:hypothetical protein AD428_10635, partial [Achromobacter sp. DMS1]|uniref:helix-turn-helix domain-containing protein n=1 Tax=Achromobacter sp. DMS1 TaxID=1688405 RepID=UPI0006C541EC